MVTIGLAIELLIDTRQQSITCHSAGGTWRITPTNECPARISASGNLDHQNLNWNYAVILSSGQALYQCSEES